MCILGELRPRDPAKIVNCTKPKLKKQETLISNTSEDINYFDLGYKPSKILAAIKLPNRFYYLVKFDKVTEIQLVRDSFMEKANPLMAIRYFEDRMIVIE